MKYLVGFSRIFVGVLFIISGLIKLNDPVGFSFKLQDYFAPDVLNLEFLVPYALVLALFVVIIEVLLGVMLIIGYAKKFTLWSLLGMIVFFTFLTFYSAYFNKVTDCGCFGDAIKLTPWESFWKDIILLVLIIVLFIGRKYIQPFFTKNIRSIIVLLAFLLSLWLGYHVLMHLPVVDFRPYKIGANIEEGMSVPEDALPPIIEYQWKYEINGKEQIITNTTGMDPQPEGGTRIGVETSFVRAPYEPPIHDFTIERNDEDFTSTFLAEENLIMVIAYNLDVAEMKGFVGVKKLTDEAIKKGYKVIGMSASSPSETDALIQKEHLNFSFYFCDMTTLKTIVRSNPGLLELNKGTILQKVHWNDVEKFKLQTLKTAQPNLDLDLKRQLDSIGMLDQKYRGDNFQENWELQKEIDVSNLAFVEKVFEKHGYPGKSIVGTPTNSVAWYVVQHSDKINQYLPIIKKAGEADEIPFRQVAMMEDRHLMQEGKEQIYGTQGTTVGYNSGNPINIIWPIKNLDSVNILRQKAGYTTTLEEYSKLLYGEDFIFKNYTLEEVNALNKN